MSATRYRTDLTEAEFERIKPCLRTQRASKWPLLMIVNAILYVCGEGVKWRALPKDFGLPWQTAYWYFRKWTGTQSWQAANDVLVMLRRQRAGAAPLPRTLTIDSQSVKNAATAARQVGTDGGKKIRGRKRLELNDSSGNLLMVKVFAANGHDGPAALRWWQQVLSAHPLLADVTLIKADHHFGGVFKKGVERASPVRVAIAGELVEKPSQRAMPVHKGRWVAERTIGWTMNSRRLVRDYERLPEHSEAFVIISSIARLLKNPLCLN